MDLVVAGRALVRGRLLECEVGVQEGRIARVAKALSRAEAGGARRLEVRRGVVLPGAVDAHVHLREPGLEQKETVATGTLAALHGGVTTVLEMPNTLPPVIGREAFDAKAARFEAAARVDWGLHAMVDADLRCFALGDRPVGYKAYLGGSTHAPGLPVAQLGAAARRAAEAGRPLVVHAEHPDHLQPPQGEAWDAHGAARPAQAEWEGIAALAQGTGEGRVLVAHVTTARGLRTARKAGLATEACPHHLLLDDRALREQGARAKVNPPLRGPKERAALWKAFAQGHIDHLASDHAPHTAKEKEQGFAAAPSGMPGVETLLPLMLAKVRARALGLGTLMHSAALAPARFFGLPKGQLAEGFDADLLVVDLAQVEEVRAARLHSKAGWTCFEGHKAVFPRTVLLRGEVALKDGEALDVPGRRVAPRAEEQPTSREPSSRAGR